MDGFQEFTTSPNLLDGPLGRPATSKVSPVAWHARVLRGD